MSSSRVSNAAEILSRVMIDPYMLSSVQKRSEYIIVKAVSLDFEGM